MVWLVSSNTRNSRSKVEMRSCGKTWCRVLTIMNILCFYCLLYMRKKLVGTPYSFMYSSKQKQISISIFKFLVSPKILVYNLILHLLRINANFQTRDAILFIGPTRGSNPGFREMQSNTPQDQRRRHYRINGLVASMNYINVQCLFITRRFGNARVKFADLSLRFTIYHLLRVHFN